MYYFDAHMQMLAEIKPPPIDERGYEAVHQTPDFRRIIRATIWSMYNQFEPVVRYDSSGQKVKNKGSHRRKLIRLTQNVTKYPSGECRGFVKYVVTFSDRPTYAPRKAYVRDINVWRTLKVGCTYDIVCEARSWEWDTPTIIAIDTQSRAKYMLALLGLLFPADLAKTVCAYNLRG